MTKILYIHHCGSRGGSSNSLSYLLKSIQDESFEKHIITVDGPVVDIFKQISKHVYVIKGIPQLGTTAGVNYQLTRNVLGQLQKHLLKDIKILIKEIKPDIVHINDVSSIQVAKVAKECGCKVVCHIRIVPDHRYTLINNYVKKLLRQNVDEIIGIDESVSYAYRDVGSINVVYNPLPEKLVNSPIVDHDDTRVNCLFLSNLLRHKGIYEVAEAAKQLRMNSTIHFFIVGSNVKPPSFYKSIYGTILSRLGIYPDIELFLKKNKIKYQLNNLHLLGQINNIREILIKSHILLFPSYMNEPSRSVFEAGVFGIPAIVAMRDKIEDVIEHGVNGLIIPEKNSHVLAEGIQELAANWQLRKKMGLVARQKFLSLNNPREAARKVMAIYNKLHSA
jgi:glycosyltransferase involved in cell wall biosynthesis